MLLCCLRKIFSYRHCCWVIKGSVSYWVGFHRYYAVYVCPYCCCCWYSQYMCDVSVIILKVSVSHWIKMWYLVFTLAYKSSKDLCASRQVIQVVVTTSTRDFVFIRSFSTDWLFLFFVLNIFYFIFFNISFIYLFFS